jgi:hypothetical protein
MFELGCMKSWYYFCDGEMFKYNSHGPMDTGCSLTPCSRLSQASCRSLDDRRRAALLPEDVGGHVGVNHMQKVSSKVAMAITAAKRQEVAALRHSVLAVADVATLFGGVRESCFLG